jgi:hypothetical protein
MFIYIGNNSLLEYIHVTIAIRISMFVYLGNNDVHKQ